MIVIKSIKSLVSLYVFEGSYRKVTARFLFFRIIFKPHVTILFFNISKFHFD